MINHQQRTSNIVIKGKYEYIEQQQPARASRGNIINAIAFGVALTIATAAAATAEEEEEEEASVDGELR
ncbi:hypothetical protein PV326_008019 [Microctonus aethiopoides]|nr:hypothetical protein PV326_008019 [Microctonus aethiopoides]